MLLFHDAELYSLDVFLSFAFFGIFRGFLRSPNAEGYVEPTPSLNAPGGLGISGYENCHEHAYMPQLGSLGPSFWKDMILSPSF